MKRVLLICMLLLSPAIAISSERGEFEAVATELATRQADIDAAVAPIRDRADLRRHLASATDSPLMRLTPLQRRRFLDSLVFTERGLASYSFAPLEGALGVTDTYRLLALFGAQSSMGSIRGLSPATDTEAAMLETAGISAMAAMPKWRHGICVVNGSSRRCVRQHGSNCSRACD